MLKIIMNWGIVLTVVALASSPAGTPGTKGGTITAPPSPMGFCPNGMRC
ncbi:MAG TPA: hypothetical protein VGP93_13810 [Polyangiaceae bacterium]|nr:hypothetical protein [Polyangiaceae bacterium]